MGIIYKIINNFNGKIYIGSTKKDIQQRLKEHKICSRFRDSKLYKAMRENGLDNFNIVELEKCDDNNMNSVEGFWIYLYNTIENGYNSNKIVKSSKMTNYYQNKNMDINICECGGKYRYTGKHCHLLSNRHRTFKLTN